MDYIFSHSGVMLCYRKCSIITKNELLHRFDQTIFWKKTIKKIGKVGLSSWEKRLKIKKEQELIK